MKHFVPSRHEPLTSDQIAEQEEKMERKIGEEIEVSFIGKIVAREENKDGITLTIANGKNGNYARVKPNFVYSLPTPEDL